jgi:hypothetical protein
MITISIKEEVWKKGRMQFRIFTIKIWKEQILKPAVERQ